MNKDGKISFEEFWDWWTYGRANKLERLVFLKLKAMNLLKKAHANFVRYGASLESKFDKSIDHHYIALNMGVPSSETSASVKINIRGEESSIYQALIKGLELPKDFHGAILRFESPKPDDAKVDLDRIINSIKELGPKMVKELGILLPFVTFSTVVDQNHVVLAIEIRHPFFEDLITSYKSKILEKFGDDFQVKSHTQIGLKNSVMKLMDSLSQKFVAFFFEGFVAESKLSLNSGFLKTIRKSALQYLLELGSNNQLSNWGVLLSLIQGSKFHMVFRELEDVNMFFKGMGVESLLDFQPAAKDILDELKKDFKLPKQKENGIFMGFINFCQKFVVANVSASLKLPDTLATLSFESIGVKELVNYMLSD